MEPGEVHRAVPASQSLHTDQGSSDVGDRVEIHPGTDCRNPSIQIRAVPTTPRIRWSHLQHPAVAIPPYRSGQFRPLGILTKKGRFDHMTSQSLHTDQGSSDLRIQQRAGQALGRRNPSIQIRAVPSGLSSSLIPRHLRCPKLWTPKIGLPGRLPAPRQPRSLST
jgi:hypothetical protein